MAVRSETLFHFTKSADVLLDILKSGFWPHYCLEDFRWSDIEPNFVAFPMVCFCDIPLSRISEHTDFYGQYGIGLSKQWGAQHRLNPILYIAQSSVVKDAIVQQMKTAQERFQDGDKGAKSMLQTVLAHCKPTLGKMVVSGNEVIKEFYQESEWRYVPQSEHIKKYFKQKDFFDSAQVEGAHQLTKTNCMLQFNVQDLRYLFVPSDAEIPSLVNFIQSELTNYTADERSLLVSRVTSLESIHSDI
jgi:hypothetical protein